MRTVRNTCKCPKLHITATCITGSGIKPVTRLAHCKPCLILFSGTLSSPFIASTYFFIIAASASAISLSRHFLHISSMLCPLSFALSVIRKHRTSILPSKSHKHCMTVWIIKRISHNFSLRSCVVYHYVITIFIYGKRIVSGSVNSCCLIRAKHRITILSHERGSSRSELSSAVKSPTQ